jgi:peptide/nickel transport system permease protein
MSIEQSMATPSAVATNPEESTPAPVRKRHSNLTGAWLGAAMLLVLGALAIYCRLATNTDFIDYMAIMMEPSGAHWFGTDSVGRDVLVRTFAAAAVDLPIALGGTAIAMLIGTLLGLLASVGNRAADSIMRIVDGFDAFPHLILILVIVQVSGGGTGTLILTIALLNIPRFIRLTRAEAMQLRKARFVFFAEVIGASSWHRLTRHILPNISGAILSQASTGTALALSAVGAMSFLGLGIAPPIPSWGAMIQEGTVGITMGEWWPVAFPALALVYCIIALNMVADSLDTHFAKEVH